MKEAGPSIPVEVIGFSDVPAAGDIIYAVEQDKLSKQVVEERKDRLKAEKLKNMSRVSLDDLFSKDRRRADERSECHCQGRCSGFGRSTETIS